MNLFNQQGNFLIQADATESESYQKVMGEQQAKLLLADPPYCLLTRRNKKGQLRDPKKTKINHEVVQRFETVKDYRQFTEDWLTPASKYLSEDAVLCIWTNFLGKKAIDEVVKKLGLNFFYGEFVWGKLSKEGQGNEQIARVYEVALIYGKQELTPVGLNDLLRPMSIITHYDEEGEGEKWGSHPNHKPFACLAPLIRSYSGEGERILDPFTGSGSTPAAAIKLGRKISGIELRQKWASMTEERVQLTLKA